MLTITPTWSHFEMWDDLDIAQEKNAHADVFVNVPNDTLEFKNTLKINKGFRSSSFEFKQGTYLKHILFTISTMHFIIYKAKPFFY